MPPRPAGPLTAPLPHRCALEPHRNKGVIGIAMPPRSIEHVALADGACRDLPALTEKTSGQWRR